MEDVLPEGGEAVSLIFISLRPSMVPEARAQLHKHLFNESVAMSPLVTTLLTAERIQT